MENKNYLFIGIAIISIYLLYNQINHYINKKNKNDVISKKKNINDFYIPKPSTKSLKLSDNIKNVKNTFFGEVNDKPFEIIRNKNKDKIYYEKDYLKKDNMTPNPIGSTEFSFVESDEKVPWTDQNVSQHPKYYRANFVNEKTDVGSFFKNNEFYDKTSSQSLNNLPDRCKVKDGEVYCDFNDRLQNIPPKLIMDGKYNKVLNSIGELKTKSENDKISNEKENLINGGKFFNEIYGSNGNDESYLNVEGLPKNVNYSI